MPAFFISTNDHDQKPDWQTGEQLSDHENREYADFGEAEKEEKMFPLPENVVRLLAMNLGV
ncbi:hypothetical protein BPIT_06140 [Candidatus Brocadia pituitae]|nr:hypothetical protein BPIT_06140 [Candidatus Brocadia pituitae]